MFAVFVLLAASLAALALQSAGQSAPADGFVGDFEIGPPGWQQFEGLQYGRDRPLGESYSLVENPVRQGQRAARLTAQHGYSMFGYGESTQLLWNGGEQEGQEHWYAWSTLFPRAWTAPHRWGIFVEWHAKLPTSPVIGFSAGDDHADFSLRSGLTDDKGNSAAVDRLVPVLSTLSKGRWNDFVMHVRWSLHKGFVEVYHRVQGSPILRKIVSLRDVPTFQVTRDGRGTGVYLLLGPYRASFCSAPTRLGCTSTLGVQAPSTVFVDGFVRERTFEAAVGRAFPAPAPVLPSPATRAIQEQGSRLTPANVRRATARRVEADPGCNRCRVVSKAGRLVARVPGAADHRDTAVLQYTLKQRNEIVLRPKVRIVTSRIRGSLVLAQLLTASNRPLVELYAGPTGTLRISSPRGTLRSRGFDVDTGISAVPGAETRELELRLAQHELRFAADGRLLIRLTGLSGPARGSLVRARVGIERYEGSGGTAVSAVYDALVVGVS